MTLLEAFDAVLKSFEGDIKSTLIWFSDENPGLGNASPLQMLKRGHEKNLIKFIQAQLAGYHP